MSEHAFIPEPYLFFVSGQQPSLAAAQSLFHDFVGINCMVLIMILISEPEGGLQPFYIIPSRLQKQRGRLSKRSPLFSGTNFFCRSWCTSRPVLCRPIFISSYSAHVCRHGHPGWHHQCIICIVVTRIIMIHVLASQVRKTAILDLLRTIAAIAVAG